MTGLLETDGSLEASRMLVADFTGGIKDGAVFEVRGSQQSIGDGDLLVFHNSEGLGAGIVVSEDEDGLYSLVNVGSWALLRFGLEPKGNGSYAFRPAAHHMELWPELASEGSGIKIA